MLHHLLKRVLEIDPARPILESDGAWTTAADLERLASRLASGLAVMGLEEGDRVALLLPNCLETVVCYLACFRMHLVVVPIDYEYHPLQVGHALGHSGASILLRVTLTPDDVALIATSISRPLALRCQVLPTLWAGGRVSLLRKVTVEHFVTALRRQPAKTFLTLTPGGLGELMASPEFRDCDFSHLRLCLAGGDCVPTRLLEAFERLTGVAVTEQCGSTETGPYAMNPPFGRKKPGSVGLPSHGVHVAVVNEHGADVPTGTVGDIRVSGPGIMDGYWNESAMTRKTLQKGWILTGDLGRFDEDGYLWFVGRRKDIIVRDGHKVAPLAVEAVLSEHPAVREACVIGVPDAADGEVPHAYVILQPGIAAGPEELRAFVAGRLAEFMVPAEVHVISKMPSKGPGKVDRALLRMRAITASLIE